MMDGEFESPRQVSDELNQIVLELESIPSPTLEQSERMEAIGLRIAALRASIAQMPLAIDTTSILHVQAHSDAIRSVLEKLWIDHLDLLEESADETRRIYIDDLTRDWTGLRDDGALEVITASEYQFIYADNTVRIPARTKIHLRQQDATNLTVELPGGVTLHIDPASFPKNGLLILNNTIDAYGSQD